MHNKLLAKDRMTATAAGTFGFFGLGRFFAEEKKQSKENPGDDDQDQRGETDTVCVNGPHLRISERATNISSKRK
jgi:hypothetical protein